MAKNKSPVVKRYRRTKTALAELKSKFLLEYSCEKNIKKVCTSLGITSDRVNKWRMEDPEFSRKFIEVQELRDIKVVNFGGGSIKLPRLNTDEDKKNAVVVLGLINQKRAKICNILGISTSTLHGWLKEDESFDEIWNTVLNLAGAAAFEFALGVMKDSDQKMTFRLKACGIVMGLVRHKENHRIYRTKLDKKIAMEEEEHTIEAYSPESVDAIFPSKENN